MDLLDKNWYLRDNLTMKICIKCNEKLSLTEQFFGRREDSPDGFRNDCKKCVSERRAAWHKKNRQVQLLKMNEYHKANRGKLIVKKRKYNKENRNIIIEKHRHYYSENKDKVLSQMKEHRSINKEKINQKRRIDFPKYSERIRQYRINNRKTINAKAALYCAKKRKTDTAFKILSNLRSRIHIALKKSRSNKITGTTNLLGCTIPELRNHLSKQFKGGMTWDNYGQWHIDHKIPCSFFDMNNPEKQKTCFHYLNLQPLWKIDNLKKSNRISF